MRLLLLSAPLAAAFSAANTDYRAEFEAFKVQYGKQYAAEEEERKFAAFVVNIGAALAENAANPEHATQGVTKFFDMTEAEFKDAYLTRKDRANVTAPAEWDGTCTACVRFPEQAALVASPPKARAVGLPPRAPRPAPHRDPREGAPANRG